MDPPVVTKRTPDDAAGTRRPRAAFRFSSTATALVSRPDGLSSESDPRRSGVFGFRRSCVLAFRKADAFANPNAKRNVPARGTNPAKPNYCDLRGVRGVSLSVLWPILAHLAPRYVAS